MSSHWSAAKSTKNKARNKSQSHEKTKQFDSIMAGSGETEIEKQTKTIVQPVEDGLQETLVTESVSQIFLQNMENSFAVDRNIQDIISIYRQLDESGDNRKTSVFDQIQTPNHLK